MSSPFSGGYVVQNPPSGGYYGGIVNAPGYGSTVNPRIGGGWQPTPGYTNLGPVPDYHQSFDSGFPPSYPSNAPFSLDPSTWSWTTWALVGAGVVGVLFLMRR